MFSSSRLIGTVLFVTLTVMLAIVGNTAAVELTILARLSDDIGQVIEQFNRQMKEAGEDLKVTVIGGGQDKILTMAAGGVLPDILEVDLILAPKLMSLGLLQPIAPFLERDSFVDLDSFMPGMLRLGQWQGQTYMLPFWSDNSMLFYSITKLEEAGISTEPPRTWDQMVQIARKTTYPDKESYGIEYLPKWGGGSFWFLFLPFVWSNGGDVLNEDGTQSLINSPQALEALQFWYDLRNVHNVSRPTPDDHFVSGEDTFSMAGSFYVPHLKRANPDLKWDVTPFPTRLADQEPATFIGGDLIGIGATTRHPELAWRVLKYLLSEEVQVEYMAQNRPLPVRKEHILNPYFQDEPKYIKFANIAFSGGRTPYSVAYGDLVPVAIPPFRQALEGEIPLQEALQRIHHEFTVILEEEAR